MTEWDAIYTALGSVGVYSALVPLAFAGLLNYLKLWLISEDRARDRIALRKEAFKERIAQSHFNIVQKAVETDVPLRGHPPDYKDIIAEYSAELFRLFSVTSVLDKLQLTVKRIHSFLFLTVCMGVLLLVIAALLEHTRPYVTLASILIIILQMISVALLRKKSGRLDELENET